MVLWSMLVGTLRAIAPGIFSSLVCSHNRLSRKLPPIRRNLPSAAVYLLFTGLLHTLGSPLHAQTFNPDQNPAATPPADAPPAQGGLKLNDAAQVNIRPQDVVEWQGFDANEDSEYKVTAFFRLNLKNNWKIYRSNLQFKGPPGFTVSKIAPPPSRKFMDPVSQKEVDVYEGGEFEVLFVGAPRWTLSRFPIAVTYVGCTEVICLFPYSATLELPFRAFDPAASRTPSTESTTMEIPAETGASPHAEPSSGLNQPPMTEAPLGASSSGLPAEAVSVPAPPSAVIVDDEPPPTDAAASRLPATPADAPALNQTRSTEQKSATDWESSLAKIFGSSSGDTPLLILLGIVFLGGLLSNLTPCVYPMIPITLRVLARQTHRPHLGAAAYAFGIIITYTSLGLMAALSGGLFGSLLASKPINILFAVLMAIFGLTMLGFGDLSKIQMVGQRFGSGPPSLSNAFAMGIGAGFVAAPCTGPILAALLAYTAQQKSSLVESTALLFTYSLGFGLPYMVLGGAFARVAKVKVNPKVQVGVKLVFAAIMFALSFYYLRIPLYGWIETMRGSWQPVAVISGLLGVLILGVWLSSTTLAAKKYASILPSAILGLSIFASSQWLTEVSAGARKVQWYRNEEEAFEEAQRQGKQVLIDMWAEWCEACKKMDATTFQDPFVMDEIEQHWIPLKLDLTELDEASEKIQGHYGIQSLPTLVLSLPTKDPAKYKNIGGFVNASDLMNHLAEYRDQHP